MNTRTFAMIFGIVFLIVGCAGFLTDVTLMGPHTHPDVKILSFFGYELGLFPVNILHNIVHLLFGVWGLLASRSLGGARLYFRSVAIIYIVLTVMGLVPGLNTTFGLIPLFGHDVWLHAVLALGGVYFGWINRDVAVSSHS
ncbi:MAG: DUF4383 domain-containing protein [Alphaproteobacteria bacterium]|nr:MAG: DUF4383 domain-containing protein [Alphaproteobacteria bacterium]